MDVERAFLSHPAILEIAVVGVEDETWGQQVAAVAVFRDAARAPSLDEVLHQLPMITSRMPLTRECNIINKIIIAVT